MERAKRFRCRVASPTGKIKSSLKLVCYSDIVPVLSRKHIKSIKHLVVRQKRNFLEPACAPCTWHHWRQTLEFDICRRHN